MAEPVFAAYEPGQHSIKFRKSVAFGEPVPHLGPEIKFQTSGINSDVVTLQPTGRKHVFKKNQIFIILAALRRSV